MNRDLNEAVGSAGSRSYRGFRKPELISAQAGELLNLRRLPAMLNAQQTAVLLGVAEHDIPVLIRARLLNPLGGPPPNAIKYFASIEVLELAADTGRLSKIRAAIYEHWQVKNSSKS